MRDGGWCVRSTQHAHRSVCCAQENVQVDKQHCQPQLGSEVRAGAMGTLLDAYCRHGCRWADSEKRRRMRRLPMFKCNRMNQHVRQWNTRLGRV